MSIERFILIAMIIISISTILYIPKDQFRKALLSLLVFQATTWFVSIVLVQTGSTVYPVREFMKATSVVFTPEFFFYPINFVWFIFLFPHKLSSAYKILHWIIFISISSWSVYFLGKYTNFTEPVKNSPILNMFNTYWLFALQYLFCFLYIKWFFKKYHKEEDNKCI